MTTGTYMDLDEADRGLKAEQQAGVKQYLEHIAAGTVYTEQKPQANAPCVYIVSLPCPPRDPIGQLLF